MVRDIGGRLARLEAIFADENRCPTCASGAMLTRRAVDVQGWPRGDDGGLRCPTCGGAVRVQVLQRAEPELQEQSR